MPAYERAAGQLRESGSAGRLAKVDCVAEAALAAGVEGYPTLRWYIHGKASEYRGGRDQQSIFAYVQSHAGKASDATTTVAAAAAAAVEAVEATTET